EIDCKIKGNFRLKGMRSTNPIAVGDRVNIAVNESGTAFITDILPRKNYIIRRASNLSKESHILASNLDQALLIVTLAHPTTSLTFIDRFLATAEAYRVPAILAINKIDLLEEDLELLEAVRYLYDSIGYTVAEISAKRGDGLDQLRTLLAGKTTLLSGNSGVGKTTLINDLIPGLDLRTAAISEVHDTGTHTTTFSEMFRLPGEEGGYLIDTPGVRGFGTIEMDEYEASHFFPEIFKIGAGCRFNNCTHTHEPHCAVLEALDNGLIAQSRYNSYLSILEDANPDKYRKPY
ncbi:MAG: ribosome small subunit-dependent GTPase A, partial [Muribaculaceae bacterium]|nr:ribosome small subunit-dependent GTPase A [Muribaculaceae bacterium]